MDWVISNLLAIAIVGLGAIIASFVLRRRSLRKMLLCAGLALLAAAFAGAIYVVVSPPGREDTDKEESDGPLPTVPKSTSEQLRLAWDSEGRASWPVAETLATISEVAYQPPVDAEKSYGDLGLTHVTPVVAGSMIGYVVSVEDVTVIAFRGTDSDEISDWIANLSQSAVDTPHGPIHKGFHNAYFSLKPQVVKILSERKPKHLWITGHSLGGALALVCAYDLIETEQVQIRGLVTFGQPMVARRDLAKYLNKTLLGRYARFVNKADVVARIPPSYTYCGSLVWFTDNGIERSQKKRLYGAIDSDEVLIDEENELQPLTEEEFAQLQAELRAENSELERLPDGTPIFKGDTPWIRDHAMGFYLELIRGIFVNDKAD